jgi:feruloyl esterase
MATWHGPVSEQGRQLWPGLNKDAALTGLPGVTTAETNCSGQSGATLECKGQPFVVAEQWIKFFVQQDPEFDLASMNRTMYEAIFSKSVEGYQNIIGTADTNLTAFRMSGGKILSWQGLADQLVPPNGTAQYYSRASSENRDIGIFIACSSPQRRATVRLTPVRIPMTVSMSWLNGSRTRKCQTSW